MTGFLLAKDENFWTAISKFFKSALVITIILGLFLTLVWSNWDAISEGETWLWTARTGRVFFTWIVIVTLLGASQKWLNRPSRLLKYMTEAIFPWYILHQTLIILAGYWLTRHNLTVEAELLLVTMSTFGGCLLLHDAFIRRVNIVRPLFGLKRRMKLTTKGD